MITISFIYSVEVTYPLKDTNVLAFLRSICIVLGNAVTLSSKYYLQKENNKSAVTILIVCYSVSLLFGLIFALLMKPINRSEAPSRNLVTGSFAKTRGKSSHLSV